MNSRFNLQLSKKLPYFFQFITHIDRRYRILLLTFIDLTFLSLSFLISLYLLSDENFKYALSISSTYIPILCLIGLIVYKFTGQYRALTRFFSGNSIYFIPCRIIIIVLLANFLGFIFNLTSLPSNIWLFFTLILLISNISIRILFRDYLRFLSNKKTNKKQKVVIYGAGEGGALLLSSIRFEKNHEVLCFIDDNPLLQGCNIASIPIRSIDFLKNNKSKIDSLILAIPSLSAEKKKLILNKLQAFEVPILQIPSLLELARDKFAIDYIKPIKIEDLLGRDVVLPDYEMLKDKISKKVIFISGASGSIGSELCRQVIINKPSKLVIFDHNEHSLYKLFNELSNLKDKNIELIPILGCATNLNLLLNTFKTNKVEIVFHAAAYKHVPLVEFNPLSGISNNVFSSKAICEASLKSRVRNVVLVSSDKAVRPTNVMGASKRLSEMIFQSFSEFTLNSPKYLTKFSMVRFGNVMNSSGSVLPLFQKQINDGGPLTITHKEITRYFMTIPEAAQLVIQSTSLAKGGDLFLLDMGEPIKIDDLAKTMIRLSGLSIKNSENPNGDIEIIYKGLRPGEKLYEELLIDSQSIPTDHKLIFRSKEPFLTYKKLWPILDKLDVAVKNMDKKKTLEILLRCVSDSSIKSFYEKTTIDSL